MQKNKEEIKIEELEIYFRLVIERLRELYPDPIELTNDFFYTVDNLDMYNFDNEPQTGVGSTFMDIEFLRGCINGEYEMSLPMIDKLSDLLKAITASLYKY